MKSEHILDSLRGSVLKLFWVCRRLEDIFLKKSILNNRLAYLAKSKLRIFLGYQPFLPDIIGARGAMVYKLEQLLVDK